MANFKHTSIASTLEGLQRGLLGEASEEHLKQPYTDLKDRPLCVGLETNMNTGPVAAMVWEGLQVLRHMPGETSPGGCNLGTIHGDFCTRVGRTSFLVVIQETVLKRNQPTAYVAQRTGDSQSCAFNQIYE
ncbi:hypothetical protein GH733_015370 [Mirounga leonina]|nr:hypothetical protein GH733_015370 [Mirounga leonina]